MSYRGLTKNSAHRPAWLRVIWSRYDRPKTRKLRIFLWATLLSVGLIYSDDLYQPIELLIQAARNAVRSHNSDGSIVVVGLDDKSAHELGGINFPRHYIAEGVDALFKAGVRRVYFDRFYNDATDKYNDEALAAALQRHHDQVYLGYYAPVASEGFGKYPMTPIPLLQNAARGTSLILRTLGGGISGDLPYSSNINGSEIVSMSASIAGDIGKRNTFYLPDWSIKSSSFPTYSFVDILRSQVPLSSLAGKDVVIGPTAAQYHDAHFIIGQGLIKGVYAHAIGAETLKSGLPVDWGRWPSVVIGVLMAALMVWSKKKLHRRFALGGTILLLGVIPIGLDALHITADVFPGLFLFTLAAVRGMMLRNKDAAFDLNEASGLPNVNALRKASKYRPQTLIALKINNFAEIATTFDERVEHLIVAELKRRLDLISASESIFQGDDTLYWFTNLPMDFQLSAHLEGLRAIIDQAVSVGSRLVDVNVTFGVDSEFDRRVTTRIGSATLCAEEAAQHNGVWKFYDPFRRNESAWQLTLMGGLDQAVDKHELFVEYQPKIDLATNSITGAEALVRWQHPIRGRLAPDEFIVLAERSNRILRLTEFVLEEAVAAAAQIRRNDQGFTVAVNLSAQLLKQTDLDERIDAIVIKHGLPPAALTLEITETAELDRGDSSREMLQKLMAHGFQISIDDYGTGQATLDYLRIMPSGEVKLDRDFVANIDHNQQDMILVGDTIATIHKLGRKVVAEGVESLAVLDELMKLGCDTAQGYLLGRPMPLAALKLMLTQSEGNQYKGQQGAG